MTILKHVMRSAMVVAISLAAGCTALAGSAVATDVNPAGWSEAAYLTIPNSDTLTLRDISLFLRLNHRFAEDTLTLRIAILTPDSLNYEEPFLLAIHASKTPAALTREAIIEYRRRVLFDRQGDYHIALTPTRSIKGVEAIGVNITNIE